MWLAKVLQEQTQQLMLCGDGDGGGGGAAGFTRFKRDVYNFHEHHKQRWWEHLCNLPT